MRGLMDESCSTKRLAYGTAGFRDDSSVLSGAMARVGVLAALRSRSRGGVVGVMVTASHNPERDNGAKVVDSDGGMLSPSWEPHAEALVNASSEDALQIVAAIEVELTGTESTVLVGRDTRPHSLRLSDRVMAGARAAGARAIDVGELTTPQLHFFVMHLNAQGSSAIVDTAALLALYYHTLAEGFVSLLRTADTSLSPGSGVTDDRASKAARTSASIAPIRAIVDGSNGIGATQVQALAQCVCALAPDALLLDVRNKVGDGPVNECCGAEVVQKTQTPPSSMRADADAGKVAASFDGDADRIVFHSHVSEGAWALVDGDKIAALVSAFLAQELTACEWASRYTLGVVQTAYANGASTAYLRSKGVQVAFAKTGVKFLHARAHAFDCGVYFEANGHGTALFSPALLEEVRTSFAMLGDRTDRAALGIRRLHVRSPSRIGSA